MKIYYVMIEGEPKETNPERAEKLFAEAEATAKAKYERLTRYSKLYEE